MTILTPNGPFYLLESQKLSYSYLIKKKTGSRDIPRVSQLRGLKPVLFSIYLVCKGNKITKLKHAAQLTAERLILMAWNTR